MNIGEIEVLAKKTAMATGKDQHVLVSTTGTGYQIQDATFDIPDGWRVNSKQISGIDLLGIAGPPTIYGPIH